MVKEDINLLFSKIYYYNYELLNKSEDLHYKCTPSEIFDFYVTSNSLSFLKNLYLGGPLLHSSTIFLTARCILEGLALKRYFNSNDADDKNKDLLTKQVFIEEYNQYKKFFDIGSENLFNKDDMINNYEQTKNYYFELLKDDLKTYEINDILKNAKLPFTCNKNLNYKVIVNKYLGEDFSKLYGELSLYIHPSINEYYKNTKQLIKISNILDLVKSEYDFLNNSNLSLTKLIEINNSPIDDMIKTNVQNQFNIISKVSNVFDKKFENSYVANSLRTLAYFLIDIYFDNFITLTECVKEKWKMILELTASCNQLIQKININNLNKDLLYLHNQIELNRNNRMDVMDLVDKAYSLFKEINNIEITKRNFKNEFQKTTGYLIDEYGIAPSLTKMVKEYSSKLSYLEKSIILYYNESQMLSHANGYMWYSNKGAFNDYAFIFKGIDECIISLFKLLYDIFKLKNDKWDNKYKTIENILRNSIKEFTSLSIDLFKLYCIPKIECDIDKIS